MPVNEQGATYLALQQDIHDAQVSGDGAALSEAINRMDAYRNYHEGRVVVPGRPADVRRPGEGRVDRYSDALEHTKYLMGKGAKGRPTWNGEE